MKDIFEFGLYTAWFNNMQDFYGWCDSEMKKLRPTGICGQDMDTVTGYRAFCNKYPTFEVAYSAYQEEVKSYFNK